MFKKPQYIALTLVAVIALIIFNLPARTISQVKLSISGFFAPLFGLAGSSKKLLEQSGETVLPRNVLAKEKEELRLENERLKIQLMKSAELSHENEQLRQALGWQKQAKQKLQLARVIGRDPANWWRTALISAGSNQGIRLNLPVLTSDGLIGRIAAVGPNRSQVLLLGDPNLRVGAVIQEKDVRENGIIISTSGPLDNNMVLFQYFSRNTAIKPGQVVITSGDGGVFPKGIHVGKIVDLRDSDTGLSTEARVKLGANLSSLEEVWVMFP